MNSTLSKIIIFATGVAFGSVVTYKVLKDKYEQLIEEEIDSVKEAYSRIYENVEECEETEEDVEDEAEEEIIKMDEYKAIAANYAGGEEEERDMDMPYLLEPCEFADGDYEAATLWYFADGVLTDEQYNIIEDVEETVGEESLTHFGDYPDDPDTVYVRNDYLEVDFEICRDERNYSEI